MLKKYSDYINENKQMKTNTVPDVPVVQEPKIKEPTETNSVKTVKTVKKKKKPIKETIVFNGKIVLFSDRSVKPSSTISLLESKNISKEKLHYIITEQNDSIVLLKYNIDTKLNMKLFIENFVKYHKDKYNIVENISFDVSDTFAIIKNISEENKYLYINNFL
jgi:hypothetical protein